MSELDIQALVVSSAATVYRRFCQYVDREDLIQEGWLWIYEHRNAVDRYTNLESVKSAAHYLNLEFVRAMTLYARESKAATLGYDPDDEAYYGTRMLREILADALLDVDSPSAREETSGPSNTDPAERGTFSTMKLDVRSAWKSARINDDDRSIIIDVLVLGRTVTEVAAERGIARQTVDGRIKRGLNKITNELGGPRMHPCGHTCECVDARLRRRPGRRGMDSGANQLIA